MGLWGSKQQKDVAIANPESIGQVFVTEDALKNVIKTVESDTAPKKDVKVALHLLDYFVYVLDILTNFRKALTSRLYQPICTIND